MLGRSSSSLAILCRVILQIWFTTKALGHYCQGAFAKTLHDVLEGLAHLRWRIVSCSWELMAASRADSCSIFTPLLCPVFFAFSAVSHQ